MMPQGSGPLVTMSFNVECVLQKGGEGFGPRVDHPVDIVIDHPLQPQDYMCETDSMVVRTLLKEYPRLIRHEHCWESSARSESEPASALHSTWSCSK